MPRAHMQLFECFPFFSDKEKRLVAIIYYILDEAKHYTGVIRQIIL